MTISRSASSVSLVRVSFAVRVCTVHPLFDGAGPSARRCPGPSPTLEAACVARRPFQIPCVLHKGRAAFFGVGFFGSGKLPIRSGGCESLHFETGRQFPSSKHPCNQYDCLTSGSEVENGIALAIDLGFEGAVGV